MTLSIGNYTITYGNARDNYFSTDHTRRAFFGKSGDDDFYFGDNNTESINGKIWTIPHIASGGAGSDYYSLREGSSVIIIDNGDNSTDLDALRWRGSIRSTYAYSVDDRHIALVDINNNSSALIIDGLNDKGRIEELWIEGNWIDVSSNQITNLLKSYNYSFEELIDMEILYPAAIGLNDANAVRSKIEEIYNPYEYIFTDQRTTQTWSDSVRINFQYLGHGNVDDVITAKQVSKAEYDSSGFVGSNISGSLGDDTLRGLAGFDLLFGGSGDDLIHGGNGRDVIHGGTGTNELHGDFGWNTYWAGNQSKDLIAVKSDEHLVNWWYGKAGNSPNGEKADIIETMDSIDEIKIIGVFTEELEFQRVEHRGVSGIGIYAKGTLEAVFTGTNLDINQIQNMTTGDGSKLARDNQIWSYWHESTIPAL